MSHCTFAVLAFGQAVPLHDLLAHVGEERRYAEAEGSVFAFGQYAAFHCRLD